MFLTPAATDEIQKIIEHVKNSSQGWDGIKPNIIKQVYSSLLDPPYCYFIVCSRSAKIVNIVPFFKNGDVTLFFILRSKIFERIIYVWRHRKNSHIVKKIYLFIQ